MEISVRVGEIVTGFDGKQVKAVQVGYDNGFKTLNFCKGCHFNKSLGFGVFDCGQCGNKENIHLKCYDTENNVPIIFRLVRKKK